MTQKWEIDLSAGRPILTFEKCSVIEGEQAEYILELIRREERKNNKLFDPYDYIRTQESKLKSLMERLQQYRKAWSLAEDGLASISGERTPKFFPESSYDLAKRVLLEIRNLLSTKSDSADLKVDIPDVNKLSGINAALKFVEDRRDAYIEEHGSYDLETGATEFPSGGDEYVGELEEIIDGIKALR